MYPVSSDFLAAQEEPLVRTRVTLTVVQSNGLRRATIDDSAIKENTFKVSRQARSSTDSALGGVFIGECKFTVMDGALDGVDLLNARVTVRGGLKLLDDTWEEYDIGVYTIAKAPRKKNDIEITAYDDMQKLELPCGITSFRNTPYALLSLACAECGVRLASTSTQISNLPNGNESIIYNASEDSFAPSTWRDFVSYVSAVLGGFAYFDADGLKVTRMHPTVDMTSDGTRRIGTDEKFEAYVSRWTSMVGTAEDGEIWRVAAQTDDGNTANVETNLFFTSGLSAYQTRIRNATFNALTSENATPFEVTMQEPPVLELGDRVAFSGGNAIGTVYGCVMKWEWTLHGGVKVSGFGEDPALTGAKSVEESSIASVYSKIGSDNVQYYPYVNTDAYALGSRTQVLSIIYASKTDTTVQFDCNVSLSALGEQQITYGTGNVIESKTYKRTRLLIEYELNGDVLETQPIDSFTDGNHIMHLFRPIGANPDTLNELKVFMTGIDGVVNIGVGGIRAMVSGRGLAANDNEWRSTQNFFERVSFSLPSSLAVGFSEAVTATAEAPVTSNLSGTFNISLLSSLLVGFTATVSGSPWTLTNSNCTKSSSITYSNGMFIASSSGEILTEEIGSDAMIEGISSIECASSGTVTVECDFGSGFMQWDGSGWAASSGGSPISTIVALTAAQWATGYVGELQMKIHMDAGASISLFRVNFVDDWSFCNA